jgi:hypothetical protein
MDNTPKPDEKICYNCKNLLWLVGIGQGIKCDLDKKSLPSRWHTCDKFEQKEPKFDTDFMYKWIREKSGK